MEIDQIIKKIFEQQDEIFSNLNNEQILFLFFQEGVYGISFTPLRKQF